MRQYSSTQLNLGGWVNAKFNWVDECHPNKRISKMKEIGINYKGKE